MYGNTKQTLNPAQITEAIEQGKIEEVWYDPEYNRRDDDNPKDFNFKINGEQYRCINGKVYVQYDFELSPELIRKLHIASLENSISQQDRRLKDTRDKLAAVLAAGTQSK